MRRSPAVALSTIGVTFPGFRCAASVRLGGGHATTILWVLLGTEVVDVVGGEMTTAACGRIDIERLPNVDTAEVVSSGESRASPARHFALIV
jgi:hypothetical protein